MIVNEKSVFDVFEYAYCDLMDNLFFIGWTTDFIHDKNFDEAYEMFEYISGVSLQQALKLQKSSILPTILNAGRLVGFKIYAIFDKTLIKNDTFPLKAVADMKISFIWEDCHSQYFDALSVPLFRCRTEFAQTAFEKYKDNYLLEK